MCFFFSALIHLSWSVRFFGKFCKVLEIENAIFQDLENFVKEMIFKMAMEELWICVWKNSKIS